MSHIRRILAVDDEEVNLDIYRDILEPLGWDVHTARSYVEAVDKLAEGGWSVVLLDQKLRGASGPDEGLGLIEEVDRHCPGATAIMVTAYASPTAIERAFAAGVYDYVEKTETFETLLRVKVERAMELHRQRWLKQAPDTETRALWEEMAAETDAQRKGRLLEDLMELILGSIPGFVVTPRRRGLDEEFDLVIRNESQDLLWSKESPYFLVECKNWSRPCAPEELDRLRSKMERRFARAKLGFLVAVGGFTKGVRTTLAAERKSQYLVVPIDGAQLQQLVEASDRSAFLKQLHERTLENPAG